MIVRDDIPEDPIEIARLWSTDDQEQLLRYFEFLLRATGCEFSSRDIWAAWCMSTGAQGLTPEDFDVYFPQRPAKGAA